MCVHMYCMCVCVCMHMYCITNRTRPIERRYNPRIFVILGQNSIWTSLECSIHADHNGAIPGAYLIPSRRYQTYYKASKIKVAFPPPVFDRLRILACCIACALVRMLAQVISTRKGRGFSLVPCSFPPPPAAAGQW